MRNRNVVAAFLTLASVTVVVPRAEAQWSTSYEQFYLPGAFNWTFRRTYPGADRLFNAFDYGHAILYERLYTDPQADPSVLEEKEYNFITKKLLISPPRVPLEESAIEVEYAKIAPEAKMMFDWAHLLHRQIYDVLASEDMTQTAKDATIAALVRYYKTRPDLAFSSVPKNMDLMEGQPYSLAFRTRYPKFNGLIWGYHWLQVGLYEPLVAGVSLEERQAGVGAAVARFRQMLENAPEHLPRMMPMTAAIAPMFAAKYSEAAIIFDNLHSMHDVVSDILANSIVPHNQKRSEILKAASRYRDKTSFAMTETEWKDMSQMMGIENMGGSAVGFLPDWPTPTVARGTSASDAMKSMQHGAMNMNGVNMSGTAKPNTGKTDTTMASMDHSKMSDMKKPDSAAAAMDHSKMADTKKPDTAQMSGMDHAKMSGMTIDSSVTKAALMKKLHTRLMADPVIHKRIMSDTALRQLMMKAMGDSSMMRDMPGMKPDVPSPIAKKRAAVPSKMPRTRMPPDSARKKPPR